MMKTTLLTLSVVLLTGPAWSQDVAQVRSLFEAGRYQEVIDTSAAPAAPPEAVYMAAQSYQKIGNNEAAAAAYSRLAELPEGGSWRLIGLSGQSLIGNQNDEARSFAQQAVDAAPSLPEAHYQLGLVLARVQNWAGAAEAFERRLSDHGEEPSGEGDGHGAGLREQLLQRDDGGPLGDGWV